MDTINLDELVDDLHRFFDEMEAFRETADLLSSSQERMIDQYPGQWVAVHSGQVKAHGDSIESVLNEVDSKGLSREQAIVRFIDKEPRVMILRCDAGR